ncbi:MULTISPECIES: hypothetical protein [Pseudomonas]|jgi:hypothetical protein|uniref:hypothetical protein n=1 Tax=Pseudomonas TaxID=286 RepID=UPI00062AF4CF|nr:MULTISPECIES: hypothetical protein [Pseudomonas]KKX59902.1 hypothetical protein PU99_20010 [Pseudomonas putida]MCK8654071.1 hypothetical protein [Pseudomonas umsongensis]NBB63251.1 hypothetical protein [Pseudomonas sp. ODNR1LW]
MSILNRRGIFLQKLGPTVVNPNEVLVSMQFALKEEGWDAENSVETTALLDSTTLIASSNDGGRSFKIRNFNKDIDGDGDIDAEDMVKLLALAKAYVSIAAP